MESNVGGNIFVIYFYISKYTAFKNLNIIYWYLPVVLKQINLLCLTVSSDIHLCLISNLSPIDMTQCHLYIVHCLHQYNCRCSSKPCPSLWTTLTVNLTEFPARRQTSQDIEENTEVGRYTLSVDGTGLNRRKNKHRIHFSLSEFGPSVIMLLLPELELILLPYISYWDGLYLQTVSRNRSFCKLLLSALLW